MNKIIDTYELPDGTIQPITPQSNVSEISVRSDKNKSINATGQFGCTAAMVSSVIGDLCGMVSQIYSTHLAYKIESRRLDIELERINKQAKAMHKTIDKHFQLKMEEIELRKRALESFYKTFDAELDQMQISRNEVLKIAQESQKKAFEPGLSMEERVLYKDMTIEITRELPKFGDKIHESLQVLIKELPVNQISDNSLKQKLLNFN